MDHFLADASNESLLQMGRTVRIKCVGTQRLSISPLSSGPEIMSDANPFVWKINPLEISFIRNALIKRVFDTHIRAHNEPWIRFMFDAIMGRASFYAIFPFSKVLRFVCVKRVCEPFRRLEKVANENLIWKYVRDAEPKIHLDFVPLLSGIRLKWLNPEVRAHLMDIIWSFWAFSLIILRHLVFFSLIFFKGVKSFVNFASDMHCWND